MILWNWSTPLVLVTVDPLLISQRSAEEVGSALETVGKNNTRRINAIKEITLLIIPLFGNELYDFIFFKELN